MGTRDRRSRPGPVRLSRPGSACKWRRKRAKSAFEEQAKSSAADGWGERAQRYLRRLSGAASPESNVTLELNGFRDARFVAVDGITEAATFSFLVRSATGWTGDLRVPPGKLRYAFIVDGKRMLDPANAHQEDKWDQDGTRRFSVRLIAAESAVVRRPHSHRSNQ